ncbi:MAG: glycosyl transferase family 2, partial [Flavobacterium sp.]
MDNNKQVFQNSSKSRWTAFKWSTRFIIFLVLLMIPVFYITLQVGIKPSLPKLTNESQIGQSLKHPIKPVVLDKKELKKYKGFDAFLRSKAKIEALRKTPKQTPKDQIRAAFYVDWDPQSYFSLQKNIKKLDMVEPEWFFIDPKTDLLKTQIDTSA